MTKFVSPAGILNIHTDVVASFKLALAVGPTQSLMKPGPARLAPFDRGDADSRPVTQVFKRDLRRQSGSARNANAFRENQFVGRADAPKLRLLRSLRVKLSLPLAKCDQRGLQD